MITIFLLISIDWGYIPPPVSYVMTSLVGKTLKYASAYVEVDRQGGCEGLQVCRSVDFFAAHQVAFFRVCPTEGKPEGYFTTGIIGFLLISSSLDQLTPPVSYVKTSLVGKTLFLQAVAFSLC